MLTACRVQGMCVQRLALVPRLSMYLMTTNDAWSVYSGNDGPLSARYGADNAA